jgi:hypothetical protein
MGALDELFKLIGPPVTLSQLITTALPHNLPSRQPSLPQFSPDHLLFTWAQGWDTDPESRTSTKLHRLCGQAHVLSL